MTSKMIKDINILTSREGGGKSWKGRMGQGSRISDDSGEAPK